MLFHVGERLAKSLVDCDGASSWCKLKQIREPKEWKFCANGWYFPLQPFETEKVDYLRRWSLCSRKFPFVPMRSICISTAWTGNFG